MKETEVTLELDPGSLKRIEALTKDIGNECQEEAAYLLEKGVSIAESNELKTRFNLQNLTEGDENEEVLYKEPR